MHAANTHYKGVPHEDELEPPSKSISEFNFYFTNNYHLSTDITQNILIVENE